MALFCGLTISPKTGELCAVWQESAYSRDFQITTVAGGYLGKGYFDEHYREEYYSSEEATGFPRVHTAGDYEYNMRRNGVSEKQAGYGTALYTSLCLAAKLQYEDRLPLSLVTPGAGISSNQARSEQAERWWTRAKRRTDQTDSEGRKGYGLAKHVSDVKEIEEEDTIEDSGRGRPDWLDADAFEGERGGTFRIDRYDLTLEVTRSEEREVEGDAYPFSNAENKHLVVSEAADAKLGVRGAEGAISDLDKGDFLENCIEVDALPLVRANYGIFATYEDRGRKAFDYIVSLAQEIGVDREDIDRMKLRWLLGADVAYDYRTGVSPELYGGGVPYESFVRAARYGTEDEATPNRRRPAMRVKLYGARPNPDDPRLMAELKRLAKERTDLGWDVFADEGE